MHGDLLAKLALRQPRPFARLGEVAAELLADRLPVPPQSSHP
jgi:hypothetical protein